MGDGRPRHGGTLIGLAGAILVAVCVSACGSSGSSARTLDSVKVERAIASSIMAQRHLHATVSCPAEVIQRAGHTFTCTARLDVGAYPVTATEVGDGGKVRFEDSAPLIALDIAKVERAIEQSIRSQRHLPSTVVCPAEVIQRAGIAFMCTATVGHRSYPFAVTEVDGNGHVRYEGRGGLPAPAPPAFASTTSDRNYAASSFSIASSASLISMMAVASAA